MQMDLIISFLFIIAWMPSALFYAHRFQYGDGLQLIDEPVLICLLSMMTPRNEFKVEVAPMWEHFVLLSINSYWNSYDGGRGEIRGSKDLQIFRLW